MPDDYHDGLPLEEPMADSARPRALWRVKEKAYAPLPLNHNVVWPCGKRKPHWSFGAPSTVHLSDNLLDPTPPEPQRQPIHSDAQHNKRTDKEAREQNSLAPRAPGSLAIQRAPSRTLVAGPLWRRSSRGSTYLRSLGSGSPVCPRTLAKAIFRLS